MTVKSALLTSNTIMLVLNLSSCTVILVINVPSAGPPVPDGIFTDHIMPVVIFIPLVCMKAYALTGGILTFVASTTAIENHIIQAVIHMIIHPLG